MSAFNRNPVPEKSCCLIGVVCPPKNDPLAKFDFVSFAPRHSIAPF
ncbi:hypothetical protein RESH_03285 [Rhodopirellula europaea SH398]|uniref:Uncharacterized protein n=1 Tax=Rhodopirellula europaea SH398 TaxID=1263868 RepID=M5SIU2_9BACT|nr:hypothetical protein RESH_03285 [Rhodopirellula europaea SH398]